MTDTYTKSIVTDFSNSFRLENFIKDIKSNISSATIADIMTKGDVVRLVFSTALSTADDTMVQSLITAHDSTRIKPKEKFFTVHPKIADSNVTEYCVVATFPYNGSKKIGTIDFVTCIACMDPGVTSYDMRVFGTTAGTVLAEKTGNVNTEAGIIDLGTISNVPTTEDILEIHIKKIGGTEDDYVHIDDVAIYHDN